MSLQRRHTALLAGDRTLSGTDEVTVRVTLTGARSRLVFDLTTTVKPVVDRPNGPGCEPTVYRAYLTARPDGTLEPSDYG